MSRTGIGCGPRGFRREHFALTRTVRCRSGRCILAFFLNRLPLAREFSFLFALALALVWARGLALAVPCTMVSGRLRSLTPGCRAVSRAFPSCFLLLSVKTFLRHVIRICIIFPAGTAATAVVGRRFAGCPAVEASLRLVGHCDSDGAKELRVLPSSSLVKCTFPFL